MTNTHKTSANVSRRAFVIGSAAAGGGLAIAIPGLTDAFGQKVLGTVGDEVGAWVVIRPNNLLRKNSTPTGPK
jgi:hypothetical protein